MKKGWLPAQAPDTSELRSILTGGLGDANMQPRGIGFGSTDHGSASGSLNGVWAHVPCPAVSGELEVRHSLGETPTFCRLWEVRIPDVLAVGISVTSSSVKMSQWTGSTCRVYVTVSGASASLCTLVFLVGGA